MSTTVLNEGQFFASSLLQHRPVDTLGTLYMFDKRTNRMKLEHLFHHRYVFY